MLTTLYKLVVVCAVLVLHLAAVSPVKADEGLDLVIDEGLIVPWEINNIAPGSSGVVPVDIRNAGIVSGYLAVWIDGITDLEGENPEAETGNTEEPGELSQYLTLDILGGNISPYTASPGFELPVALNSFPGSISYPLQLSDQELQVGGAIQIQWRWAIPPQTSNNIQGDSVSFNIHYVLTQNLLVERPSASTPAIPGGGYLPGDTAVSYTQGNEEVIEDITDSGTAAGEQHTADTSGNTTIIHSSETDTADDSGEVIPPSADDNLKPDLPGSKDSLTKTALGNISSIISSSAREMLSRISLIIAVCGTLVMIILAYFERKRRDRRRVVKG